jgi:UDP-galactopyranose mutase
LGAVIATVRKAILVVGAGFAGATYARELAEAGWPVEVIDRRDHIGGTAYDAVDATGTRRHVYGPHLFHTSNERVVQWLGRFGALVPYEHRVTALVSGRGCLPLPINRATVNGVFGQSLGSPAEVEAFLAGLALPNPSPRNAAEHLQARIGRALTDLFYRPYSRKMWGLELEEMDAAVVARIPIRHDDEDRYFPQERFQALPRDGYTAIIAAILEHPAIRVTLNQPFERSMLAEVGFCFTSMPIDVYFEAVHGHLPYRSLRFHHRVEPAGYRLGPTAQVNLTDGSPFTRENDWSRLPGHHDGGPAKTVTREEPCDWRDNAGERFYPLRDAAGRSEALYQRYVALAEREPKLRFIGRCGTYRYLDMDQVINQSLQGARAWIERHG